MDTYPSGTPMTTEEKSREMRLRRMADRQGLRLVKSGRRDPRATDYRKYMLVDQLTNSVVVGIGALDRAELTMDDVENYLTRERN